VRRVRGTATLKVLHLADNKLKELSPDIKRMQSLETVRRNSANWAAAGLARLVFSPAVCVVHSW
jgi:hypothetical protein